MIWLKTWNLSFNRWCFLLHTQVLLSCSSRGVCASESPLFKCIPSAPSLHDNTQGEWRCGFPAGLADFASWGVPRGGWPPVYHFPAPSPAIWPLCFALHKHWCCSDFSSWSREQIPLGEGINIPTALGPFSSRHTTSAQGNCERWLGVCNFRERSFVLKEPCVQSALPWLESCQKSSGIKDKRQRRPSKAQHTTGAAAGELQLSTPPRPWAAWAPRALRITQEQLWASVTATETSLSRQLSLLCPRWHTLHNRDLPYHLHLHLSWNRFSYGNFMFWSCRLG